MAEKQLNLKLLMFLLSIILAGTFYWFQWKPALIRRDCSNPDLTGIEKTLGGKVSTEAPIPLNKLYRICLALHGLKPEDLYWSITSYLTGSEIIPNPSSSTL